MKVVCVAIFPDCSWYLPNQKVFDEAKYLLRYENVWNGGWGGAHNKFEASSLRIRGADLCGYLSRSLVILSKSKNI